MKIVHMVASLKGGGIQNLILSLVPEQVSLGHKVSVIVTDEDNLAYSNKNKEFLQNAGVSVYNLDRKVSDKISFFKTWIAARRLVGKLHPDIVNSHGIYCHNASSFAVFGKSFKHCCTIHNAPEKWGWMPKIMNYNVPLIFCSDAALQLRGQSSKMMVAINNGIELNRIRVSETVDLHEELGIPQEDKIVVLVGSTRPQKNYSFLIKIVEKMQDEHVHFCICGGEYKVNRKGGNNNMYISLDEFKKYRNIHLLGLRNDVPAVLNGADAYLSCSVREGLPISALEGFFSGIPCVLSPILQHTNIAGGIAQCYIPKAFEPQSFIKSIYQAVNTDCSHDVIYESRKETLKKFLIDRCAKEYVEFYEKILNK